MGQLLHTEEDTTAQTASPAARDTASPRSACFHGAGGFAWTVPADVDSRRYPSAEKDTKSATV